MSSIIQTDQAHLSTKPFSQAIRAGDFVYVSGQVGVAPGTQVVVGDTLEAQTTQAFANIEAILKQAGLSLDHIINVRVHLTNLEDIPEYNEIYARLLTAPYPTRTTVVSVIGPYLIEIDAIAYAPSRRGE